MNKKTDKPKEKRARLIEPRTLKGFRDYLPAAMIPREQLIATAQSVYRSFGFSPIDTPALEYLEILTGKGSDETDRQLYRFTDHGGREVGMRFDLTVPLARFMAQHSGRLGTPFKAYHIGPVWRGENTQRGRYREFMQCDFDTIGTRSVVADIEAALVIERLLSAIGFERFTIHINNRMILNGLLERISLLDKSTEVLRALDKLAKIGRDKVAQEMMNVAGATSAQADEVLRLSELSGSNAQILEQLVPLVAGSEVGESGHQTLTQVIEGIVGSGANSEHVSIDVSIARGLDYYTGTVFETVLDDLPGIGSVCSGGRYDNLAELYTRQQLPGIGASLGLDRLLAAMEELEITTQKPTTSQVLIAYFDKDRLYDYLRIAAQLRAAGIRTEVYPEPKRLGQQLKYADQRQIPIALIAGEEEFANGQCQLKNLRTGKSDLLDARQNAESVIAAVRATLKELI